MTERERMLAGELYDPLDAELVAGRRHARNLLRSLNDSRDADAELRAAIIQELFGSTGAGTWIEPPFFCDYGSNITLGDQVFFNFNCVVLDPAPVRIGSNVLFGPAVQIYTATHPLDAETRRTWKEFAKPVTIGSDVWIGGAAVICPGVSIGDRTVIGAGSVVARDVPAGVVAAGNPCRVIRVLQH
ncbi:MAG TPA: sugar O-acetyltransferase [Gemmataceae bacterium]|jgi:maltose O-acetyltransferase|nr:sugar O-acetyltransferase [Gemmataceae bacterium]